MGVKILLVDDSPTVHKVIKIILKDEPCEIFECSNVSELSDKLARHNPAVVFLDFNFSETQTGYELTRKIKSEVPKCKVLVMYGTFDNVDESSLREVGAEEHVVKPFDTTKFIQQVRGLTSTSGKTLPSARPTPSKPAAPMADEGWTIRESVERKTPDIGVMTQETVSNINDDLDQWGLMVPGVIGKSSGTPDLPPVMETKPVEKTLPKVSSKIDAQQLPDANDLEYPDISGPGLELEATPVPKSKLVSLNELAPDEFSMDRGSLPGLIGVEDDEGDQRLAALIQDEVEEELWSVDAFEEKQPKLSVVREEKKWDVSPSFSAQEDFAQINDGGPAFDDSLFEPLDKQDKLPTYNERSSTALPANLEGLRPLLKDLVKEAVAEYCRQHVDKVAWEVIPDLAENLIKNELRKLSDQVSKNL